MPDARIPAAWRQTNLASLADYVNGFAFNEEYWSAEGWPIVRIAQITGSQGIVDRYAGLLPDTYRIDNGDLIFSWSGTLAVVRWDGGPAWLNQHLFKVIPRPGVDRDLLFHLLQASVAEMNKRTHGSTMKHIKRGELREFKVSLPEAAFEQRTLARVLDTLDTTIRQTEAIIEKLKQVKQGMLHDLLTRGIDANGELRPPQHDAPHLYVGSQLGWMPIEWRVCPLDRCTIKITDRDHTTPTYLHDGVLMISPTNLYDEDGIDFANAKRISARAHAANRKKTDLEPGDLIIHRIGAGLGRVRLIGAAMPPFSILHSMAQIRPDLDVIKGDFLLWALRAQQVQRQIELGTQSIGVPDLGLDKIGSLLVAVPSLQEQELIVDVLSALQSKLASARTELEKLRALKSGLMDDLLTGRVRVTSLLPFEKAI